MASFAATSTVHRVGTRRDPHKRTPVKHTGNLTQRKGHAPGRGDQGAKKAARHALTRTGSSRVRSLRAWIEQMAAAAKFLEHNHKLSYMTDPNYSVPISKIIGEASALAENTSGYYATLAGSGWKKDAAKSDKKKAKLKRRPLKTLKRKKQ